MNSGRIGRRSATIVALALVAAVVAYVIREHAAGRAGPIPPDSSVLNSGGQPSERIAKPSLRDSEPSGQPPSKEQTLNPKQSPGPESHDAVGAERAFQDSIGSLEVEALKFLLEAIRLDPTQAKFYAAIVNLYVSRGDALNALEYLQRWSEIEPGNSLPCAMQAWAHFELGDSGAAMKALDAALGLGESKTHLLDIYGSIIEKAKAANWNDDRTLSIMAMSNPSALSGKLLSISRFLDSQAAQEKTAGDTAEARRLYLTMSSLGNLTTNADCIMLRIVSLSFRERALKGCLQLSDATSEEASTWQYQLTEIQRERERLQAISKQMLELYDGDLSRLPTAQVQEYINLLRDVGEVEATRRASLTRDLTGIEPK